MELIGCECQGLPAHDHYRPMKERRFRSDGSSFMYSFTKVDPDHFHLWVDWKEVARELMVHS